MTDLPPKWKDMTPEQKGALLLAQYEGKTIEQYDSLCEKWFSWGDGIFRPNNRHRVKPEPVRETVTMYGQEINGVWHWTMRKVTRDAHALIFDIVGGEIDRSSVRMEKLKDD